MSLFSRSDPAPAPEITGTQALRARVRARWKKVHLSKTAADLSISLQALESFAQGFASRGCPARADEGILPLPRPLRSCDRSPDRHQPRADAALRHRA
jgi:hypothetical protein